MRTACNALAEMLDFEPSFRHGWSEPDSQIRNTVNASLYPNTPTTFRPGDYSQMENVGNLDLGYRIPMGDGT